MSELSPAAALALVRGRFAPSPTGPLHFGSLVAAVASYLDARSRGGEWLVRIEDLDPPREIRGAADDILRTLEAFGLQWDGPVRYQSRRTHLYAAALSRLSEHAMAYPCACTRREIAAAARIGVDGPVYPGSCREGLPAGRSPRAWRLRVPAGPIALDDECFGVIAQDVARAVGDFVLRRADGWFAYQLAVVVDDADQAITRVVRGADLIDSSQRQILLQRLLDLPTPGYLHVPAAVDARGDKLSKQTRARPLEPSKASGALFAALGFLRQAPPAELAHASADVMLQWAQCHWRPDAIPPVRSLPAPAEWYR
ncbi:MAG: tRNA glutamyl-Q(34) synthetase GluQRS [Betaproteobacteria bacterium]|nr:tRNA glutamyl-Q(34) synthetase GluQRS [Betaproteobacteria bacterium]